MPSGTSNGNSHGGPVRRAFSCPFTRKTTLATPTPVPSFTPATTVPDWPRARRSGAANDSIIGASESRKTCTPAEPARFSASVASTVIGLSCWSTSATPGTLNVAPAGLAGSPAHVAEVPLTVSASSERSFTVPATVTVASRVAPPAGLVTKTSGAVRSIVTGHGTAVAFPARSSARTWKTWPPSARPLTVACHAWPVTVAG